MDERLSSQVEKAIMALEADISDRRGLKWEWNKIDDDVKEEIRVEWRALLINIFGA